MLPLELLVGFWVNKVSESFSILLAYRNNYCNAQQTFLEKYWGRGGDHHRGFMGFDHRLQCC